MILQVRRFFFHDYVTDLQRYFEGELRHLSLRGRGVMSHLRTQASQRQPGLPPSPRDLASIGLIAQKWLTEQ